MRVQGIHLAVLGFVSIPIVDGVDYMSLHAVWRVSGLNRGLFDNFKKLATAKISSNVNRLAPATRTIKIATS